MGASVDLQVGGAGVATGNPVPVSIVSGATTLSDVVLTDDSGAFFLARDSGSALTYVTLAGAVYVPSTNIKPSYVSQGTGATGVVIPTGGVGMFGWLSGIFNRLGFSLSTGTVDATTLRVITASDGPLNTNLGTTADAAVITDADGSVSAKLRGLIKLWLAGLTAGENHIGQVGGNKVLIASEQTLAAGATPYTANDVVGVITEIANFARINAGTGYIVSCKVSCDKKSVTPRLRIHFFNAGDSTLAADNAQYKELYADGSKRLTFIDLPAMTTAADSGNSDMSRTFDMAQRIPFKVGAASRSLWYIVETIDGPTFANGTKLSVTVGGELD